MIALLLDQMRPVWTIFTIYPELNDNIQMIMDARYVMPSIFRRTPLYKLFFDKMTGALTHTHIKSRTAVTRSWNGNFSDRLCGCFLFLGFRWWLSRGSLALVVLSPVIWGQIGVLSQMRLVVESSIAPDYQSLTDGWVSYIKKSV